MKDKRAIIIKDSKLQRIRNNFRSLFASAVNDRWNRLFDEMGKLRYTQEGVRRPISKFSADELVKFRALQKNQNELTGLLNRSICSCIVCGKGERDMVYNKPYNSWYCTECYGMERRRALSKHRKGRYIEDHSKTFT